MAGAAAVEADGLATAMTTVAEAMGVGTTMAEVIVALAMGTAKTEAMGATETTMAAVALIAMLRATTATIAAAVEMTVVGTMTALHHQLVVVLEAMAMPLLRAMRLTVEDGPTMTVVTITATPDRSCG